MNKTSKADFELFKKECEKWIEKLGLKDWYLEIEHENSDEQDRAWCTYNIEAKNGIIFLTRDWENDKITKEKIKLSARHEVHEINLGALVLLVQSRNYDEHILQKELHTIIRRLEKLD